MTSVNTKTYRRAAREDALKALYAWELGGGLEDDHTVAFPEAFDGRRDEDYFSFLTGGVKEHRMELDAEISAFSENWRIERISKIDLTILRIAIYEMLFSEDTPCEVSMNEAIELDKKFGSGDGTFVGGILAGFYRARKNSLPEKG